MDCGTVRESQPLDNAVRCDLGIDEVRGGAFGPRSQRRPAQQRFIGRDGQMQRVRDRRPGREPARLRGDRGQRMIGQPDRVPRRAQPSGELVERDALERRTGLAIRQERRRAVGPPAAERDAQRMAAARHPNECRRIETEIGMEARERWRHRDHRCEIAQAIAAGAVVDHHYAVGLAWQAPRQRCRGDPATQVRAQHSDRGCHAAAPIRAR
ncbi:hypothetical protein QP176_11145 [Sphingomonas aerolata]